jgi:hypothetical protein
MYPGSPLPPSSRPLASSPPRTAPSYFVEEIMQKPATLAEAIENARKHVPPAEYADDTAEHRTNKEQYEFAGHLAGFLREYHRDRVTDQIWAVASQVINRYCIVPGRGYSALIPCVSCFPSSWPTQEVDW